MDETLAKLREEEIEKHFQMGYSLNDEQVMDGGIMLEFFRSESPKITTYIQEK